MIPYLTIKQNGVNVHVTIDRENLQKAQNLLSDSGINFGQWEETLDDLVEFECFSTDKDSARSALEEIIRSLPTNFDDHTNKIGEAFVEKETS